MIRKYIPIESFKFSNDSASKESFFGNDKPYKKFHSSGTSSRRSTSLYSKNGLELYRKASIAQIEQVFSTLSFEPKKSLMVSWVPTTKEWPNSSLAQMIRWFSEEWPAVYLKAGELPPETERPLWIFTTALDLFKACNQHTPFLVNTNSLVFETGGTKTQGSSFNKKQLYSKSSEIFGLPNNRIISEYGMSELACQAYDFFHPSKGKRCYRFSSEVQVRVETLNQHITTHNLTTQSLATQGIGCLTVYDPARIDYPYFIRTQDIVDLHKDGTFHLIGRVPNNLLKGCSLLSERKPILPKSAPSRANKELLYRKNISLKAAQLTKKLISIFKSQEYSKALQKELISKNATQHNIDELVDALPANPIEWLEACKTSIHAEDYSKRWLYILSTNHSIVGLHPLVLSYLLDMEVTLRIPKIFSHPESALNTWLRLFAAKTDWSYSKTQPDYDILNEDLKSYDAILAYGSDQTIHLFSDIQTSIKAFANHSKVEFSSDVSKDAAQIIKNSFSLGQKGCLDTQVIVTDKIIERTDIEKLQLEFQKFWGTELSYYQKIALKHEALYYQNLGANLYSSDFTIALFPVINSTGKLNIQDVLSDCPFVLPILYCKDCKNFQQLETSTPKWDGTHLGAPIFYI